MTSNWSCLLLLLGSFSCSHFLSSLLRTFNDFLSKVCPLSHQLFLKSHVPLLFPILSLLQTHWPCFSSKYPQTCLLQGLGASRSLCLIIPWYPQGLFSHFLQSCLLREPFHSILIYSFKFAMWFNFSSLAFCQLDEEALYLLLVFIIVQTRM